VVHPCINSASDSNEYGILLIYQKVHHILENPILIRSGTTQGLSLEFEGIRIICLIFAGPCLQYQAFIATFT